MIVTASKSVYITGIAGFLGCHLAEFFLKAGWDVSGCDNLIGGDADNVPAGARWDRIDCADLNALSDSMRNGAPDVVIHCACTAYEGLSVFSPYYVTENTSGIATSAISAAIKIGARRFVYCSSMARYGHHGIVKYDEAMLTNPVDPYGIAKVAGERILAALAKVHGLEYAVVVPHNIYGPKQKYDDPYRNVAAIMVNRMLQGLQPCVYGDGSQKRCFSYIDDVVPTLFDIATAPKDLVNGQTYNIGPDSGEVSILDLAKTLASIMEFDLKPIFLPPRPMEVHHAVCSSDKIRQIFGFKQKVSLKDGLSRLIEYILDRGVRPFKYHMPVEIISDKTPHHWISKSWT